MPKQFTEGWNTINWKEIESRVSKLQNQIYRFAKDRDIKKVRKLQNYLLSMGNARLLAVRKVTQDNRGKVTAGIDGIKSLQSQERLKLAENLCIYKKAKPVKRIYIPKPGKDEKRPLGIPTIEDRALQALVKLALEPEWEAYFEPNSYGFRPGRSCHDAIAQIKISIERSPKYVLDADISKCFDSIDHDYLLRKLNLSGSLKRQIQSWLKAGYVSFPSKEINPTELGTPQGGVISPLLANIALHGLETSLKKLSHKTPQNFPSGKPRVGKNRKSALTVVRYADDFVVMHDDKEVLLACVKEIEKFLKPIGLKLSEAKSRITHTFDDSKSQDGQAGFDFLGFRILQKPTTIRSVVSSTTGGKLGFKTLIYPSMKSQIKHQRSLSKIIRTNASQDSLITNLNPVISGWSRYFGVSDVYSLGTFQKHDQYLFLKLYRWSSHQLGSGAKAYKKYWIVRMGRKTFANKQMNLCSHLEFASSITQYRKVKGDSSPYDGNTTYWKRRQEKNPLLPTTKKKLFVKQKGICSFCNSPFRPDDILEIHHILPKKLGGTDKLSNLSLVHGHCHDKIHSTTKPSDTIE